MSVLTKDRQQDIAEKLDTKQKAELRRALDEASRLETRPSTLSGNGASSESNEDDVVYSLNMDDPYRYGWRYAKDAAGNNIFYDRIPLTLEDLLHPEEEDFRMQNPAHIEACVRLRTSSTKQLKEESSVLILYDVRVDWNVSGVKPFGPDITVILDGKMEPKDKGTYVTGEDGVAPIMVIEVTSPSTRDQDFYEKPILMQQVGLPYYYVVDLAAKQKQVVYGYELTDQGCYIGIRPDEQGRVWVEPLALWLGIHDGQIQCHNAQNELILSYEEIDQALDLARAWASEETHRADEEAALRQEAEDQAKSEAQKRKKAEAQAESEALRAEDEIERRKYAEEQAQAEAEQRRVAEERAAEASKKAKQALADQEKFIAHLRSLGIDPATILTS